MGVGREGEGPGGLGEEPEGWLAEPASGEAGPQSSLPPIAPVHTELPVPRGPRMVRGRDDPTAWRVRNLSHLWGRLRDFYQVRGRQGGCSLGEAISYHLPSPLHPTGGAAAADPVAAPDLQMLGFDPFSGALPHHPLHPFLLLPTVPPR